MSPWMLVSAPLRWIFLHEVSLTNIVSHFSISAQVMLASRSRPLIVSGLFPFEHKISVMHFQLRRNPEYQEPIKGIKFTSDCDAIVQS
jgi:hypothetical protein